VARRRWLQRCSTAGCRSWPRSASRARSCRPPHNSATSSRRP
jgi:hypothetical protein